MERGRGVDRWPKRWPGGPLNSAYRGITLKFRLVQPHELKVPSGAQVMGGRRNLSRYKSKQEASCVSLRAKWVHICPFPSTGQGATQFQEETAL